MLMHSSVTTPLNAVERVRLIAVGEVEVMLFVPKGAE
jgi:hypothetical protein